MGQQPLWERMEGEPSIWYGRFRRYLLMYPKRSIAAVFHDEHPQTTSNHVKPRQKVAGDWYEVAHQWKWEERAEAWDAAQFEEEQKAHQRVYRSGWALDHNRVLSLAEVAQSLKEMMSEVDKVWIPDVKGIGTGPDAERVDLKQFNDALFREFREYLTDLAEETGGRVKKTETAITSLPKIYTGILPDDDGSEE